MARRFPVLAAPLLVCTALSALAACSAPSSAGTAAPPPASSASASASATAPASSSSSGGGSISFTGAISGTMAMFACHPDAPAQLVVSIDGEQTTYNGVIDADDFSFLGPGKSGWTLADGSSKPEVSGRTYTVTKAKLVGVFDDRTVTADGSVTCPAG